MQVRLGLVTALSLPLLVVCPIRAQTAPPTAADALTAAKALFTQTRYDEAIASYQKIQTDYPTAAADAQRMIGVCYQWKKDYPKAMAAYRSLLTGYPASEAAGEAYYWLGLCDEAQGNVDLAIVDFTNEVKYFPTNTRAPLAMLKAGERYQEKGQYDEALKQFNAVLATAPEQSARANLLIGICYQAQGKYADAQAAFQKAVDAGSDASNEARLRIDELLRAEKDYSGELAYLQRMYDEVPELRAQSLTRQAEVMSECLGGTSGATSAIETLKRLMREFPDDLLAIEAEARIAGIQLLNLRDFAAAEAGLRNFMAKYPAYPALIVVAHDLADCIYLQRNYSVAASLFLDATKQKEVGNYVPTCLYMAADCYMRSGDFRNAKLQADLLIATYPAESWAALAKINYANLTKAEQTGGVK